METDNGTGGGGNGIDYSEKYGDQKYFTDPHPFDPSDPMGLRKRTGKAPDTAEVSGDETAPAEAAAGPAAAEAAAEQPGA